MKAMKLFVWLLSIYFISSLVGCIEADRNVDKLPQQEVRVDEGQADVQGFLVVREADYHQKMEQQLEIEGLFDTIDKGKNSSDRDLQSKAKELQYLIADMELFDLDSVQYQERSVLVKKKYRELKNIIDG